MAATFEDEAQPGDVPWLVLSLRWSQGEHLVWYATKAQGYTTDVATAGRFTERQARYHEGHMGHELAVPEAAALAMSRTLVLVPNEGGVIKKFRGWANAEVATP